MLNNIEKNIQLDIIGFLSQSLNLLVSNPENVPTGICGFVTDQILKCESLRGTVGRVIYRQTFDLLMGLACKNWEHYSGCEVYPIKHPDFTGGEDGDEIYIMHDGKVIYESETGDQLPLYEISYTSNEEAGYEYDTSRFSGEYGRRRLELVHRMLDILEQHKSELVG